MKHRKGFHDIHHLMQQSPKDVPAVDLANLGQSENEPRAARVSSSETADPILDQDAIQDYREQLQELDEELDQASANNDLAEQTRLEEEKGTIAEQLKFALGPRGQSRTFSSNVENARTAARRRISTALKAIGGKHTELGKHLTNSISTGQFCYYRPEPELPWELS